LGVGYGSGSFRLLAAIFFANDPGCGVSRAPLHDPARLRTWFFLSPSVRERLGRPASRCVDADAYDDWRRAHAIHHANSGHLDRRGIGDIDTLTVREFQALAFWGRLRYRLYRHPLVMFGLGAAYQFLVRHRLPIDSNRHGWRAWVSAMANNLAIAIVGVTLIWFVGIGPFLLVHLPITFFAGSVGVWLFYVQHQFEQTFWAHGREWNFHEASLRGSSHYDLPGILRWFHSEHRRAPCPPSV
jgi:acyl-lipid omega-6 desaturase (Delta-12 desaturase)